jgi:hypothetical protein
MRAVTPLPTPADPLRRPPAHLAQRHVANVRQRRDDQPLLDAQVLVAVLKVDVADGDDDGVALLAPVEADLL